MFRKRGFWKGLATLAAGVLLVGVAALAVCFGLLRTMEVPMAVRFGYVADQGITFDAPAATDLTQMSFSVWVKLDGWADGVHTFGLLNKSQSGGGWYLYIGSSSHRPIFMAGRKTTSGIWAGPTNSINAGQLHHIVVTYNALSDSNDPVIYIDGAAVAVSEVVTPSGGFTSDYSNPLGIGGIDGGHSPDGDVLDVRIYNRILSAGEVAEIYQARGRDGVRYGLVFRPVMIGAAGLSTFDGSNLGAGNTILDEINGIAGTPSGTPVGAGDTLLAWGR